MKSVILCALALTTLPAGASSAWASGTPSAVRAPDDGDAESATSADVIACFDAAGTADRVLAARALDDEWLPHLRQVKAIDLATLQHDEGASPLAGEGAPAYLARIVARLHAVAPTLASGITQAYRELKGHVLFDKASVGPTSELRDPSWEDLGVDRERCLRVPVAEADEDGTLHIDARLFSSGKIAVRSLVALVLHRYLNRMAPQLEAPQIQAVTRLLLLRNADATYDSYLRELGEQGLLPNLPLDGKVWAAPGYAKFARVLGQLIAQAYNYLPDKTVASGPALRIGVEAFGDQLSPGFACPRSSDANSGSEDSSYTYFRACQGKLSDLLLTAPKEAQRAGAQWIAQMASYLTEKSAVAQSGTLDNYEQPPEPEAGQPEQKSLRQKLESFGEFTPDDLHAIAGGIAVLLRQIGESIGHDGALPATEASPDGASGPGVLADLFTILRATPLHYLDAKVPQIDSTPRTIDLWSGVGTPLPPAASSPSPQ